MNPGNQTVFTVSQVNECVRFLLEDSPILDSLYVSGEISNLTSYHTTGHLYFSLKDAGGVLSAVMFRSSAQKLKFRPENGMKVLVHGRISVYPQRGVYQLYADAMEPDGLGSLAAAYEQLKNKLAAEGLFDETRKKPLPRFPSAVGVITSPTGAAVRDIINILGRRCPQAKMILFPTLVQGEGAPKQLASGIRFFNARMPVDVIIIGRGGGSLEELWAFNDETLARAVAASDIPVISAVGHETDFTICDFAADCRAPTPSAAAELAVPDTAELQVMLGARYAALQSAVNSRLRTERNRLAALAGKRVLQTPDSFLENRRLTLDALSMRMEHAAGLRFSEARQEIRDRGSALSAAMERCLSDARTSFTAAAVRLDAMNPLSVLTRGYSAVFSPDGTAVRSAKALTVGEHVTLRLSDGSAEAEILTTTPDNGNDKEGA